MPKLPGGLDPAVDLTPFGGRWIAILRGHIVAQGETRQAAMLAARRARHKETPLFRYVPSMSAPSLHQSLDSIRPALPDGAAVYLVGGAVRDHLLQRPIHDLDFATDADGIELARAVAHFLGADIFPLDEARGTGRVIVTAPDGARLFLDFAVLRGPDLESDLRARDFTINAIALDARDPARVFDPLGGAQDVRDKRIRACSDQSFKDDPLRVLRAVRQAAALGFGIDPGTRALMRAATPAIARISPERLRDELLKILGGSQPATSLRALEMLGLLPALFPELVPMKGVAQSPPHIYDVWEHTLAALRELEAALGLIGTQEHNAEAAASLSLGLASVRLGRYRREIHAHLQAELVADRRWRGLLFLAMLYHDAGKPAARSVEADGRIRFIGHEEGSAALAEARARALKLSNDEIGQLKAAVRHHMRLHQLVQAGGLPSRRATYRFFRDTREAGVDICLLTLADVLATYGTLVPQELWKQYLELDRHLLENWWERPAETVRPPALVSGHDLIERFGLSPGRKIGELLEAVREAQAAGEVETREDALGLVAVLLGRG
jgi:tRNA nucleotidyltransferase/poly(A) polymerase